MKKIKKPKEVNLIPSSAFIIPGLRDKTGHAFGYYKRYYEIHKDTWNYKKILEIPTKRRTRPCIKYDMDGNELKRYESLKEAGLKNNIDSRQIQAACSIARDTGAIRSSHGFIWEYA